MSATRPATEGQPRRGVPALLEVRAEGARCLWLRYEDGTMGTLDLCDLIARGGVLAGLKDADVFAQVRLGEFGQVEWPEDVELCADALYLRLTRKSPDQIFPGLSRQSIDA